MWFDGPVIEGSGLLGKAVRCAESPPMAIIHGMHQSQPAKQFPVEFLKPQQMEAYLQPTTWLELELPTFAMTDTGSRLRNSLRLPAGQMAHGVIITRLLAVSLLHVQVSIPLLWNMEDGEL